MSSGKTDKKGRGGRQGLLKFLFRSILATERLFWRWGPGLESRPRLANIFYKGQRARSLGFAGCTVSAAIIRLCCYGAEAATDITQTNECGHVPITFYFQKQAEDWIWLVGHRSLAPGGDPHNSCSPSRHLPWVEHLIILAPSTSSLLNPILVLVRLSPETSPFGSFQSNLLAFYISTNYPLLLCFLFVPLDYLHPLLLPPAITALWLSLFTII